MRSVKFIRKIAVFVCLLLSAANCYGDQKLSKHITKQVEQEVIHVFNGLVEASKALNVEGYFEFFDTEKFVGLPSNANNSLKCTIKYLPCLCKIWQD